MIAASRNGTIAVDTAEPSPMREPRIAVLYDMVAMSSVDPAGPPLVSTLISWKSVKVKSTENVITTAMIGVSSG